MATTNKRRTGTGPKLRTHEGAPARRINPEQELRRSVMACLLWEDSFYEEGEGIAQRIADVIPQLPAETVSEIAIEARSKMNLRHAPLFVAREMARNFHGKIVGDTIATVVQRADELAEFLALYWKEGRQPLAKQVKRGLALAFPKFNEYSLAKYNRENAIKLRDVLFMVHAKPKDAEQGQAEAAPAIKRKDYKRGMVARHADSVFTRLVQDSLESPETWENRLSRGENKKAAFTKMLQTDELGALALLRNLRNMEQAGVSRDIVIDAIRKADYKRVLPFRFIAAARACPSMEEFLDEAMVNMLSTQEKIPGKTIVVIDISGSMAAGLSSKSDMTRMDAACALGSILREICEEPRVYATSGDDFRRKHATKLVPARRGMALVDAIEGMQNELGGGGIFLNPVMKWIKEREERADQIVVITDEQDCAIDPKDSPLNADAFGKRNFLINVQADKNGIGYGKWTHIDGFSEGVVRYIVESIRLEKSGQQG